MSSLSNRRIEPLHQEFIAAAKRYPHLRLVVARPHDSIIPWPSFPSRTADGETIGLSSDWWKQVLGELDRGARACLGEVEPLWLWLDGELWQGAFYWQEKVFQVDGKTRGRDPRRLYAKFQQAIAKFLELADSAANHFEMPSDPDFWGQGIGLLEARGGHRWLEKLNSVGLYESCPGCSTQLKRLKANLFLTAARAIEFLSDDQRNPLYNVIEEAAQAWSQGYEIVATRMNLILAEKGAQTRLSCRRPDQNTTLQECRRKLAHAFRDIPLYVSGLPQAASEDWRPWPVGMINSETNPPSFVGRNYMPITGDELDQVATLLRGRPADWPWHRSIVQSMEDERRNWDSIIEQMRVRVGVRNSRSDKPESHVELDPPLSVLKQDILVALLNNGVTNSIARLPTSKIAVLALGPAADVNTFKGPMSELVTEGLVHSKKGRGGGAWLSVSGQAQATQIKAQREDHRAR